MGLGMLTARFGFERPRSGVISGSCLSTSCCDAFFGMKSQIDEAELSWRIEGSGVFPRDTQTPSTSTPRSSARMPKGTSSARGTPGPRRLWLISRCRACSFLSFSATTENLRSCQWVYASFVPPRHIVRAMPQPSIYSR